MLPWKKWSVRFAETTAAPDPWQPVINLVERRMGMEAPCQTAQLGNGPKKRELLILKPSPTRDTLTLQPTRQKKKLLQGNEQGR